MTRLCALVVYVAALVALLGIVFGLASIGDAEEMAVQPLVSGTTVQADGVVAPAPVEPDAAVPLSPLTEAEAAAEFKAAQERYKAMAAGSGVSETQAVGAEGYEVAVFSDPDKQFLPGGDPKNVALDDIRLVVDVEDVTLRNVVNQIVSQAAEHTGGWTVKWRLKPENSTLPEERVNLTAEAKFGDFVALLAERVRNLSGVQLYITAFAEARVILVTDTYY